MFNPYSVLNWKLFWWLFDWVNTVPLERFCMFSPLSFSGDYPVEWARFRLTILYVMTFWSFSDDFPVEWTHFRLSYFVCLDLSKPFWSAKHSHGWTIFAAVLVFTPWSFYTSVPLHCTQSRLNEHEFLLTEFNQWSQFQYMRSKMVLFGNSLWNLEYYC